MYSYIFKNLPLLLQDCHHWLFHWYYQYPYLTHQPSPKFRWIVYRQLPNPLLLPFNINTCFYNLTHIFAQIIFLRYSRTIVIVKKWFIFSPSAFVFIKGIYQLIPPRVWSLWGFAVLIQPVAVCYER